MLADRKSRLLRNGGSVMIRAGKSVDRFETSWRVRNRSIIALLRGQEQANTQSDCELGASIRTHEKKVRGELSKPFPNDEHIAGWEREIEVWKRQIERLDRRLRRNW